MKFAFAVTSVAVLASSASALVNLGSVLNVQSTPLCKQSNYGAVGKPWQYGSKPGFTCGKINHPSYPKWDGGNKQLCNLPLLAWTSFCRRGNPTSPLPTGCVPPTTNNPHPFPEPTPEEPHPKPCPPPANPGGPVCKSGFQAIFTNFTTVADSGAYKGTVVGAATIDDSYLTYALADTIDACLAACKEIDGCTFVNTYYDIEEETQYAPKRGGSPQLTCAFFGQCVTTSRNNNWGGQGNGRPLNHISNSDGYCMTSSCKA